MRYRDQRLPCDTEALATLSEETRHVRFLNLSATGARIAGLGRLPRNALVPIRHLTDSYPALVVWATEKHAGVRFIRPLSGAELSRLRGRASDRRGSWAKSGLHCFRELT